MIGFCMRGQSREELRIVYAAAYMTSTADARCPENVSKLRQVSGLLLRQRREFIISPLTGTWRWSSGRPRASCVWWGGAA